jgi:dihydropteroate synthase
MLLYGVVNASPDSLNSDSIVDGAEQAVARATRLLAEGCQAIDLGGQGSTDAATVVGVEAEWARLAEVVPAIAALGVDLSIDSWRPEVARRALRPAPR